MCQTEYNVCFDLGGGGETTCSYEGTDLSCSEINECTFFCSQQKCMEKGSVEGQSQFNGMLQCLIDNCFDVAGDQEAFEECVNTNCSTETQTCFQL